MGFTVSSGTYAALRPCFLPRAAGLAVVDTTGPAVRCAARPPWRGARRSGQSAAAQFRVWPRAPRRASAGKGMSDRRRGWLVLTTALLDLCSPLARETWSSRVRRPGRSLIDEDELARPS
jgi:hypothetical protein